MLEACRRKTCHTRRELWIPGWPSTTLSDSHLNIFELQHPFEIVRLRHEEVGGQDFLDDGPDSRQREMRLTASAPLVLEKTVGEGRQDHMALPSRQAAAFERARVRFAGPAPAATRQLGLACGDRQLTSSSNWRLPANVVFPADWRARQWTNQALGLSCSL